MELRLLCVLALLNCPNQGLSKNPSVIIIGAGPAGIAAATKLLQNSITNITIFEAENRIGGRINTVKFNKGLIELGAEYCHGEKENIVYETVKSYDLLERAPPNFFAEVNYSNGSTLDSGLMHEWEELLDNYYNVTSQGEYNTTGKSIGEVFIHHFNDTLLKKYENDADKLKIFREALRSSEGLILSSEGAFSWFDSSQQSDFEECAGNQQLLWKQVGYKTILELLMKSYPDSTKKLPIDDKIRLNSRVKSITWGQNQTNIIETYDEEAFSADYVIFTPSIGVLKKQSHKLFKPELPYPKEQAIEAIGIGGVVKVFLHFSNRWWHVNDTGFTFLWRKEDLKTTVAEFPRGPSKDEVSWVAQIRVMVKNNNDPDVWVAWVTGDLVPQIEKLSDGTLKAGFEYVLNKFLGKRYNLTEIESIVKTNWRSNRNFLGTYSFDRPGFYQKGYSHRSKLADPLLGTHGVSGLLFAGEATNPIHYSTVHGAIETGHREAERIIKLQKKN